MIGSKDIPVGMLVIYDAGFKFKYKKYYLRKGSNIIGSNPNCHVVMSEGQNIADKVANLQISTDLATIEPLDTKCVYVPSNIKKKSNLMVEISPGIKYVIEMEKDFVIAGRKVLMQVTSLQQLLQVKGVTNEKLFDLASRIDNLIDNANKSIIDYPKNQHYDSNYRKYPNGGQFEATIPIQSDNNFEPTIPVGTFQYEATQLIEDDNGLYDATLPLDADVDLIPQSYHRSNASLSKKDDNEEQPKSRGPSYNNSTPILSSQKQQKKQTNSDHLSKIVSEGSISMPQTIKQDQMPATIKQEESIHVQNRQSDMFAPTIQENQMPESHAQQIKKKTMNMTKSQPAYRQIKKQKLQTSNLKYTYQQKSKPVDSFEDLFGGVMSFSNSNKTTSLISNPCNEEIKKKIKQTHSENGSNQTQKLQSDKSDNQQNGVFSKAYKKKKRNPLQFISQVQPDSSQKQLKKCYVIGKKLSKVESEKLMKKGYESIQQKKLNIQDLDLILIEGDLQLSQALLLALIAGKQIKPLGWLNNQSAKLNGKLQGFTWESIQKRKGKGNKIFSKQRTFYLQQQLGIQFGDVMRAGGAEITNELSKSKARQTIYIVVNEKDEQGKQLYDEYKNYKKWSFYSRRMIIESVLMGEEIIDKYKLDAYSF